MSTPRTFRPLRNGRGRRHALYWTRTGITGSCLRSMNWVRLNVGKTKNSRAAPALPARPMPPDGMGEDKPAYLPAPEVLQWMKDNILTDDGSLYNPEHKHLEFAHLEFLWAAEENKRQMRRIIGLTEEITFRAGAWVKGRQEQQMREWFGDVPKWLITLDANFCQFCSDAEFCALVEHELFHIGHKLDEFGQPAFTQEGLPKLGLKGHDVEEFIGVVKRYGIGHPEGSVAQLVKAAQQRPEVSMVNIAQACGTCMLKAA